MEDRRDDGESPPNPPLNRIYIVLEHMGMDLKQYMSSYGTRELLEVPLVQVNITSTLFFILFRTVNF